MANIVITGTQWGDEGKGKIVDLLAAEADIVVHFRIDDHSVTEQADFSL